MTAPRSAVLLCLLTLAPGLAFAQAPDPAAERARLANQRIQAEAERRAQEQLESQAPAPAPASAPDAGAKPPNPAPATGQPAAPGRPASHDDGTQRALEQLRELGELRDAGYLTDEEFQRIKQRILDSHF